VALSRAAYDRAMARSKEPEPVVVEELKNAILRTIVEQFDGRPLTWDICEQALAVAAFEIKQAALLAPGTLIRPDQRSPKAKRSRAKAR
jgi:hypothetical protein